MLFTLYGDYAYPRGVDLWLGSLVALGARFHISEVAVRSAVARLSRDGWLVARRESNRSYYALTERGRALIEEGTRRIYRQGRGVWNHQWCLLTYAIPETHRARRDGLRKQLAWLGFGALGGGTYISPHAVAEQTEGLAREHDVTKFARIFEARFNGPVTPMELVRRCWDLESIARYYDSFIKHYEPMYARDAMLQRRRSLSDADAFVHRFALTHDFRRFPFIDPELPVELLPRTWSGSRARELFESYHRLLSDGALAYFKSAAAAARAA